MADRSDSRSVIHVVAAAVVDAAGQVLIAQRPPGKPLAGGWEFPGGKLERGESREAGLVRELAEELGILIRKPRPLLRVLHAYPHGEVLIDMWVVRRYDGEPRGLDGQALRWLTADELDTADLLPADRPLVRALRLPDVLRERESAHYRADWWTGIAVVHSSGTPLQGALCAGAEEALAAAAAGAEFVALDRVLGAAEVSAVCAAVTVPVYVRGLDCEAAWRLGASGLNAL